MPALIFDCDGVLADTEIDGHLRAFNETFIDLGLPAHWTPADYSQKVRIGGGKERLASLLTPNFIARAGLPKGRDLQLAAVASWHAHKTEVYGRLVRDGLLPARDGVARLAQAAHEAGWDLAVASTSAERSVRAVLGQVVEADLAARFSVFAGDAVARKKPAPDIYRLALAELGIDPAEVVVVEDSQNGLTASASAGLRTIVTVNALTQDEDFAAAVLVVSSLGDPPPKEPARVINDPFRVRPGPFVTLDDLHSVLDVPHADLMKSSSAKRGPAR